MRRILLVLLILLPFMFAWSEEFSANVAVKALGDRYPRCIPSIVDGAKLPYSQPVDPTLGEPSDLHCDLNCPAYDPNFCNLNSKQCVSSVKAGQIKEEAEHLCDCEQASKLAEAITYFIAKEDPMNRMIKETCAESFYSQLDNLTKSSDPDWILNFHCNAPNKTFTFTREDYEELIYSARSFAFANAFSGTQQWYCYNLGGEFDDTNAENPAGNKSNGQLCYSENECLSGNCINHVCCEQGKTCCPSPGVKGYPCDPGNICSENYYCVPISLENGQVCESEYECMSGNCRPGSRSMDVQYCCDAGYTYCCQDNSDCLSNELCENHACVSKNQDVIETINETNDNDDNNNNKNSSCISVILIPLTLLLSSVVLKN